MITNKEIIALARRLLTFSASILIVLKGTIQLKFSAILAATIAFAGLAISVVPAKAEPALADGVCPAIGLATGCNLLITFNANGSVTTSPGSSPGSYDDAGDTLIGVVNNSASTIIGFNISSNENIFGFASNGIDGFDSDGVTESGDNPDTTGYGGPDGFFTNITGSATIEPESGTVNFANGGIPADGTDYFSLEGAVSFNSAPTLAAAPPAPVPEPATVLILGVGLVATGATNHFRRKS